MRGNSLRCQSIADIKICASREINKLQFSHVAAALRWASWPFLLPSKLHWSALKPTNILGFSCYRSKQKEGFFFCAYLHRLKLYCLLNTRLYWRWVTVTQHVFLEFYRIVLLLLINTIVSIWAICLLLAAYSLRFSIAAGRDLVHVDRSRKQFQFCWWTRHSGFNF